ncbi:transposase [Gemmobacter denitrificans]|uniref:transposase n=1 Tax=Gemmobacter denitrificans TaxID=3123040 RepID=UPI0033130290
MQPARPPGRAIQPIEKRALKRSPPSYAAPQDNTARRIQLMLGIAPIAASVLTATLLDVAVLRSPRDLSLWLGLTPKPSLTKENYARVSSPMSRIGVSGVCSISEQRG